MPDLNLIKTSGIAARDATLKAAKTGLDRTSAVISLAVGVVGASLSSLNNFGVEPELISRIGSAASNHGVAAADLLSKLPGELEQMGNAAVDAFLKSGDALGKHWSHLESQRNASERANHAANGIWEDGTTNIRRGSADMAWRDRIRASADNHLDGLIAAARTPEFWHRTLGNAVEASVYAAAIAAVDQLFIHRDRLINGSNAERQQLLIQILQTSGLMAAGALPVSIVLALALMLVPGLVMVMGPLGLLGTAGLGLRLLSSIIRNPSRQELEAIEQLKGRLRATLYDLQRDSEGNLTIPVQSQAV